MRLRLARALVADFAGLRDLTAEQAHLAALERDPEVTRALARDRAGLDAEARALDQALALEARLRDRDARAATLAQLDTLLGGWARIAAAADPSAERQQARRLLGAIAAGATSRAGDAGVHPVWSSVIAGARERDAASCRRPRTCDKNCPSTSDTPMRITTPRIPASSGPEIGASLRSSRPSSPALNPTTSHRR